MVNPWRGEVELVIDGKPQTLRLTLGALAELEAKLQSGSLVDLVQRFESGAFSSRDVLALVVAARTFCRPRSRAGRWLQRGRRRSCWCGPSCSLGQGPMTGFDWPVLMRAGMRGLGLRPEEFWALTPAELQLLLGESSGAAPMGRARLDELLAAYPDRIKETGDD